MFYPTDPSEMYGLFALRLGKYKAHFYTRGTAGLLKCRNVQRHNHSQNWIIYKLWVIFVHVCSQVLHTVGLLQIMTAQYLLSSRPTIPLSFSTWRSTPQSTTLSSFLENLTSKPCCSRSYKSRKSLRHQWCSERARYQKESTQTWSLAAILSVAPSRVAAGVDGTNPANNDNLGKNWSTHWFWPQEVFVKAPDVMVIL